jgi:hypothetical protein
MTRAIQTGKISKKFYINLMISYVEFHLTSPFPQCKQEVVSGAYDDWKRDTVDEAKKRAIYSAPSYDHFKSLVAGCKDTMSMIMGDTVIGILRDIVYR